MWPREVPCSPERPGCVAPGGGALDSPCGSALPSRALSGASAHFEVHGKEGSPALHRGCQTARAATGRGPRRRGSLWAVAPTPDFSVASARICCSSIMKVTAVFEKES